MPVAIGGSVGPGSGRTPAMNCVSPSDPGVLAKIAPVPVRDTKKRPERLSTATPSGLASLVGAPGIVKTVVGGGVVAAIAVFVPAAAAAAVVRQRDGAARGQNADREQPRDRSPCLPH